MSSTTEFWKLGHSPDRLAVVAVESGLRKTYGELLADVDEMKAAMPSAENRSLLLLLAQNRYECLVAYLAALNANHPLMLVDSTLNHDLLLHLVETYRPEYAYAMGELALSGYEKCEHGSLSVLKREKKETGELHGSLSLLLSTSGSTGSPKLVRLSKENLQANADSICTYLDLTPAERPILSLPMAYSYGLSVINSHLLAGATLVLTEHTLLRREFWDAIEQHECTSFAGVPYTYQMLLKTGLLKKRGASLRTLTQAGGALASDHIHNMYLLAQEREIKFFVMYGQTEATARISYVPFESLGEKIGAIGVAIPNGSLRIDEANGELVYSGRNVMLGYAESREDLAKGDELHGVLRTGDLARQDADGFFYVTGRLKRFLKLFGKRFNLDEVEQIVQRQFGVPVASLGNDDLLRIVVESNSIATETVAGMVRDTFGIPKDVIRVEVIEKLPRTDRGKTDYRALANSPAYAAAAATQTGNNKMEIGIR